MYNANINSATLHKIHVTTRCHQSHTFHI